MLKRRQDSVNNNNIDPYLVQAVHLGGDGSAPQTAPQFQVRNHDRGLSRAILHLQVGTDPVLGSESGIFLVLFFGSGLLLTIGSRSVTDTDPATQNRG